MALEMDDFDRILASEEADLSALPPATIEEKGKAGTPAIDDIKNGWVDEPASGKLDKIREVFLNAKTPTEVYNAAALMPIGDWLDIVVKLSPKDIKVSGGIAFRHMMAEMGPINKEDYRPQAIECEYEALEK